MENGDLFANTHYCTVMKFGQVEHVLAAATNTFQKVKLLRSGENSLFLMCIALHSLMTT